MAKLQKHFANILLKRIVHWHQLHFRGPSHTYTFPVYDLMRGPFFGNADSVRARVQQSNNISKESACRNETAGKKLRMGCSGSAET